MMMMELTLTPRGENGVGLFMCACSDNGRAECDELMAEVKQRLTEEWGGVVTDANFLHVVVVALEADYDAHINGIYIDQWAAVTATEYSDSKKPDYVPFGVYAQCDQVETGVAAVWKVFADRKLTQEQAGSTVDSDGPRENMTDT